MSALPPKADIAERDWHVRFVPIADIPQCDNYSISSSLSGKLLAGRVEFLAAGSEMTRPFLLGER